MTLQTIAQGLLALIMAIALILLLTVDCDAQSKVKYCRNAETGEVITVPADTPCPYPTHEL